MSDKKKKIRWISLASIEMTSKAECIAMGWACFKAEENSILKVALEFEDLGEKRGHPKSMRRGKVKDNLKTADLKGYKP